MILKVKIAYSPTYVELSSGMITEASQKGEELTNCYCDFKCKEKHQFLKEKSKLQKPCRRQGRIITSNQVKKLLRKKISLKRASSNFGIFINVELF